MSIKDFIAIIVKDGFMCKAKSEDKGRFVISKPGFIQIEVFELQGHVQIIYDPAGRYPAQIDTKYW